MTAWKVSEEQMTAIIQEINLIGQNLLKLDKKIYSEYFSSGLADSVLNMLGLSVNHPGLPEPETGVYPSGKGDGPDCFKGSPYHYIFNSPVFLDEKLLKEVLMGFQCDSGEFYNLPDAAEKMEDTTVRKIQEDDLMDLIQELNRLRHKAACSDGEEWGIYFGTSLPDIILDILGLPETYIEPWDLNDAPGSVGRQDREEGDDDNIHQVEKDDSSPEKISANFCRSFYEDMFNYPDFQVRECLKGYLGRIRERQGLFRGIKAKQAKLGDKWEEADRFQESLWKRIKSPKV